MPVQQVLTNQRVPVKIWTDDVDERSKEHPFQGVWKETIVVS